jgi:hypothetical protein
MTLRKEKTMTRARLILLGTALTIAATSAAAQQDTMPPESASAIYDVDDDRDGRIDRLLILEQSDSLA